MLGLNKTIKIIIINTINLIFLSGILVSQTTDVYTSNENSWVDSTLNSMTMEQRVAQLIFVRANYPNQPYFSNIDTLITSYNIGGVVFFKGSPIDQALQTNHWNSISKVPLMVAIDAEWGLAMRLSKTVKYPLQMTLGAVDNDNLIYAMGKQIGYQCKRLGIHMNFAPVVDVNSNPKNPVIGMRSFGQNPLFVAQKGMMYMKGLQKAGVIACAKHFPGHGNTTLDSHYDLPVVSSSMGLLKDNDLMPFQYLIDQGVQSIMIAHLAVPAMDDNENLPSTLSHKIVTDYLVDTMGFDGLIVTDGLDMKGVTKNYNEGEVALKALEAGNDILLIPDNVELSINNIINALKRGDITENIINESCRKILKYKFITGASEMKTIDTSNLIFDLNKPIYRETSNMLTDASITLLKNNNKILPVGDNFMDKRAMVVLGTENKEEIESAISAYGKIDIFHLAHNSSKRSRKKLLVALDDYDLVIVAVLNTNILAKRMFGITESDIAFVHGLTSSANVVLDIFASPYALDFFDLNKFEAVLVSYHENKEAQRASAKMIMLGSDVFGSLPVDAGGYKTGHGLSYGFQTLYTSTPKNTGVNIKFLDRVDSTAMACIAQGAFPGCQIIAAKDGAIFYNKSFGSHTYSNNVSVRWNDVYDLASLTKILATTPAMMKMREEGKVNLNDRMSDYLLMLRDTDKDSLNFIEVLSHTSGLQNWIPFYQSTITEDGWDTTIYMSSISEDFPTRVADKMYVKKGYENVLYDSIIKSPFQDKTYHYSGLGFYLCKEITEDISNQQFDDYLYESFYKPLGISYLRFNPRDYFPVNKIIPTENDTIFRNQLLRGDVHDQGAAILGGVSGNAGLFGNSYGVAVFMQMLMNGGGYGETVYLNDTTIDFFNTYHYAADSNRRGLGFDKPLHKYEDHRTNCKDASPSSFGHSGFTGTYAWADPENGLVYVFLSNRIYPDMNNNKLMDWDVRTNIHQLFYEAIKPE